jgi:hypothetical protein
MGMRIRDCTATIDTIANTLTLVIFFSERIPPGKLTLTSFPATLPLSIALVDPRTGTPAPTQVINTTPLPIADFTCNSTEVSLTITLTGSTSPGLPLNTVTGQPVVEGSWIRIEIEGTGWATPPSGIFAHQHDAIFYTRVNSAGGARSGRGGGLADSVSDLQSYPVLSYPVQSYPVLTEDITISETTRPLSGPVGGTSTLAKTADEAIGEVLSWRTKSDDPRGFVGVLNQAFDLKEVEGHTESTWTPGSYNVQTDLGAVTGAQAGISTRANAALDQSLCLLDGLYALIPYEGDEDPATVQALVRTQFTALVTELGVVGGPRVPRVDELFELLLGPGSPTNPEDSNTSGSLGFIRQRFGLERRYVTTVDDEQNLTNYMILVDYVISLKQSWNHEKGLRR